MKYDSIFTFVQGCILLKCTAIQICVELNQGAELEIQQVKLRSPGPLASANSPCMSVNPIKGCGFLCAHRPAQIHFQDQDTGTIERTRNFRAFHVQCFRSLFDADTNLAGRAPKFRPDKNSLDAAAGRASNFLTGQQAEKSRTEQGQHFCGSLHEKCKQFSATPVAQTLEELPKGHRGMWSVAVALEPIPWHDPNPPSTQKYYFCKAHLCSFLRPGGIQQIIALSLPSKCKNLKWMAKKLKTGKLHITFPSDYKHLDHLDLGTEQF